MTVISKKWKMAIVAPIAIALVAMVAFPIVGYAEDVPTTDAPAPVIVKARGVALQKADDGTIIKLPANMTLAAVKVKRAEGVILFKVLNGTVNIDGTVYTIDEGVGIVLTKRQAVFAWCKGVGPNGETVTLKLAAKYLWMWGNLYVGRIKGIIRIGEDTRMLLLLRGATRIP